MNGTPFGRYRLLHRRAKIALASFVVVVLVAAGVVALMRNESGGDGGGPNRGFGAAPPKIDALGAVGEGEGELNLIAWAGYVENGSNDPANDWVTPFEKDTGCKVNVDIGNTSD